MDKKLQSVAFRIKLAGQGIVNYDGPDMRYTLQNLVDIPGITRKDNQMFGKRTLRNKFKTDEERDEAIAEYAENNECTLEEAKKRLKPCTYNIKISSNCLRNKLFPSLEKVDATTWENPRLAAMSIASPDGLLRGYLTNEKSENGWARGSVVTIVDAIDENAVTHMEFFTTSGQRDENSIHIKETCGKTLYETLCFFDVMRAQFICLDDMYGANQVKESCYEGDNYLEKAFLKIYGRIPYEVGTYQKVDDEGRGFGAEYGLKLDDQMVNRLVKELAHKLLSIFIPRANAYAGTISVEYKPIYDVLDTVDMDNGWTRITNENEIPDFEMRQFYVLSEHCDWKTIAEHNRFLKEELKKKKQARKDEKENKKVKKEVAESGAQ